MGKDRLAAFSDGVIAIIITIMVLELKVPHGSDLTALMAVTPNFVSYVLSFIYLAIYWNNHHHLLHTVTRVDGLILWANSFLLFWLSLIPAATAWMGENFRQTAGCCGLRSRGVVLAEFSYSRTGCPETGGSPSKSWPLSLNFPVCVST